MSQKHDERFTPRPGRSKQRSDAFVRQVARQINKAGIRTAKNGRRPGARLGRGQVAARFAHDAYSPDWRRVTVKTRLVNLTKAGARSTSTHLRYIERDGVGRQGEPGQAYGPLIDHADWAAFELLGREDRHQFRIIVSPEDAESLDDLRTYTRQLMVRMEADLGTRLDWVAVDHWNTDNPHTHIVLRGKDETGRDLIISRDYIAEGMRWRAAALATEWLGPRTELEMQHTRQREVEQARWTGLDRTLQRLADNGRVHTAQFSASSLRHQRQLLIGRLQYLARMGLACEQTPGVWDVQADAEKTLRAMGERGDIIRAMQRAMHGQPRELAVFQPGEDPHPLIGRVAGKGLADELYDRGYLVIDGVDGKAHYVVLPPGADLAQFPSGSVVEVNGAAIRQTDRNIVGLASAGIYRTEHHLRVAQHRDDGFDPHDEVAFHVRRLEALRRAGIVERVAQGVWCIPDDLPERGRQYDIQRLAGGATVSLQSPLPVERQIRAIGATWLDQQLLSGNLSPDVRGFGGEVRAALRQRVDFLISQGLAVQEGQRVRLVRNLLATLRQRELEKTAQDIARKTGLVYRSATDGQRISGIYRRSLLLASGRYAMLDDGLGFSLVPWKPVIEPRLGQSMTAIIRGNRVAWEFSRQRGPAIG
ncbi:relaxase/mobilization nuclease and DUF3363 domain-containing protein [Dickeya oryzae]|uniref:relaxase/mobilization nuclease and DUF3363 domain-containing protein n=1 Tax=Dickeya oryzae TaxID=1240404 RepID=UPI001AED0F09|nr:relaxase/mobilization nuclease and DUF3363 domain-containing protein [Dickeya oryzae]MBP2847944.1 relaxase/mobilization nuclease and DUF3363 domain-containing protein [Dickeya oryzae]